MRPRRNPEVNKSWMCDEGRLLYKSVNENRIETPLVAQAAKQVGVEWPEALGQAAKRLAEVPPASVAGLCSPDCTNEELWLFRRFLKEAVGAETLSAASLRQPGFQDDVLLRTDRHPNSLGVRFQGPWSAWQEVLDWIRAGVLKVLVVFRNDPLGLFDSPAEARERLAKLHTLIVIDSNWTATAEAAHIVLPVGSFAEREGTYVNFQGRVQRTCRAYPPRGHAKPDTEVFLGLAERLGRPITGAGTAAQIWQVLSAAVDEFKGISYGDIGKLGAMAQGYGAAEQTPR
jgi:NADH-quinone oxidoreductase subunit G